MTLDTSYLVKMKDCTLLDIQIDNSYSCGCITCDYGSEYVTEIVFVFDDKRSIKVEVINKNNGANSILDTAFLMILMCRNVEHFKKMEFNEFLSFMVLAIHDKIKQYFISECYFNGVEDVSKITWEDTLKISDFTCKFFVRKGADIYDVETKGEDKFECINQK